MYDRIVATTPRATPVTIKLALGRGRLLKVLLMPAFLSTRTTATNVLSDDIDSRGRPMTRDTRAAWSYRDAGRSPGRDDPRGDRVRDAVPRARPVRRLAPGHHSPLLTPSPHTAPPPTTRPGALFRALSGRSGQ